MLIFLWCVYYSNENVETGDDQSCIIITVGVVPVMMPRSCGKATGKTRLETNKRQ